jgi:hypothetical protein
MPCARFFCSPPHASHSVPRAAASPPPCCFIVFIVFIVFGVRHSLQQSAALRSALQGYERVRSDCEWAAAVRTPISDLLNMARLEPFGPHLPSSIRAGGRPTRRACWPPGTHARPRPRISSTAMLLSLMSLLLLLLLLLRPPPPPSGVGRVRRLRWRMCCAAAAMAFGMPVPSRAGAGSDSQSPESPPRGLFAPCFPRPPSTLVAALHPAVASGRSPCCQLDATPLSPPWRLTSCVGLCLPNMRSGKRDPQHPDHWNSILVTAIVMIHPRC